MVLMFSWACLLVYHVTRHPPHTWYVAHRWLGKVVCSQQPCHCLGIYAAVIGELVEEWRRGRRGREGRLPPASQPCSACSVETKCHVSCYTRGGMVLPAKSKKQ